VKSGLSTRILSESDFASWNGLVARSPDGSIYSTPEYLDALCEAAGGTFRILAAEKGNELLGGIALWEQRSDTKVFVTTRLLLYYNGFVLRPYETRYPSQRTARHVEILESLAEGLAGLGYDRIRLRCRSPLADVRALLAKGWSARPQYTYVVPLTDLDALRQRMDQNLRRLVDRCTEQGLSVTEDDDFESFFRLHSQIHDRKGAKLYLPHDAFEGYFRKLKERGLARLFHARLPGGASISTQLVLVGAHPVSHTVSAAADAEHLKLGATAFLRWSVFRRLSELGSVANDLTDAALNPVTHFKAQLGGDLQMCLALESPGPASGRGPYAAFVGLVRRMSRALAQRVRGGSRS
jgi:Acetyltransferase (GNAT) domain